MVINLKVSDRTLKFTAKGRKTHTGEGIEGLLSLIEDNSEPIIAVNLTGRSSSYTFSRQVALLTRILRRLAQEN